MRSFGQPDYSSMPTFGTDASEDERRQASRDAQNRIWQAMGAGAMNGTWDGMSQALGAGFASSHDTYRKSLEGQVENRQRKEAFTLDKEAKVQQIEDKKRELAEKKALETIVIPGIMESNQDFLEDISNSKLSEEEKDRYITENQMFMRLLQDMPSEKAYNAYMAHMDRASKVMGDTGLFDRQLDLQARSQAKLAGYGDDIEGYLGAQREEGKLDLQGKRSNIARDQETIRSSRADDARADKALQYRIDNPTQAGQSTPAQFMRERNRLAEAHGLVLGSISSKGGGAIMDKEAYNKGMAILGFPATPENLKKVMALDPYALDELASENILEANLRNNSIRQRLGQTSQPNPASQFKNVVGSETKFDKNELDKVDFTLEEFEAARRATKQTESEMVNDMAKQEGVSRALILKYLSFLRNESK